MRACPIQTRSDTAFRTLSMCALPIYLRELFDREQRLLQRSAVVLDHTGAPLELVHGQPGKRGACPARGQSVARPSDIIAQDGWRIEAEENGARSYDPLADRKGFARHHFAMFRRKPVDERHRVVERFDLNKPAVLVQRSLDELLPGQLG